MTKKNLSRLIVSLMLTLWASQPVQSQPVRSPEMKRIWTCGDLLPVQRHKKSGFINKAGRLSIPLIFNGAQDFSEGLAAVKVGKEWGYIDASGKVVIRPQFDGVGEFSEGLAVVYVLPREPGDLITRIGYIDRAGNWVIQAQYESLQVDAWASSFSEGLASVLLNDKVGFVDKTGQRVILLQYEDARPFSEGLAAVKTESKYGYIDKSGKMVIPPQFEYAFSFSEGLASILIKGKWGYTDKSGKIVIRTEFNGAESFSEGLAAVKGKDGKWGYIDKTGNFVIPPRFDEVGPFSDGLAPVLVKGDQTKSLAYINKRGQMVIKSLFLPPAGPDLGISYYSFCGGVARVGLGRQTDNEDSYDEGYINKKGKLIWP